MAKRLMMLALTVSASVSLSAAGCHRNIPIVLSGNAAYPAPLFSSVQLGDAAASDKQHYNVFLVTNNHGPGDLKVQLRVQGDPKEYVCNIAGFSQPASSHEGLFILGEVRQVRRHSIIYRMLWQRGNSSGKQEYEVSPEMRPVDNH